MLRKLIGKLITGEKALSAVTTLVKLLAAVAVAVPLYLGSIKTMKRVMFNKWAKENREETRFVSDSLWRIQLMRRLDVIDSNQMNQSEDLKVIRYTQNATVKAIDRHLSNEKKFQEQLQFQNDQIEALKKND
jgi:hypothetical protein